MYLKYTFKNCIRDPLRFSLFVILIFLSTLLLIIQFCIYEKGSAELERTRQTFKVIGCISFNEDAVDDSYDRSNYILTEEDRALLTASPYIKVLDPRFNLIGRIKGFDNIVTIPSNPSEQIFIQGHIISKEFTEDRHGKYWDLEVSVDNLYYAKEDPNKIIHISIPADDDSFDYDKLFSGTSYSFFYIHRFDDNKGSIYSIFTKPLKYAIFAEDDINLEPEFYANEINYINSISAMKDVFPITYTMDLLSIPDFFNGIAAISQGRTFTKEEYENGNKVCIISQELASKGGYNIGDSLNISVTEDIAYIEFRNRTTYSLDFHNADFEPEASYNIIGLYKTKNINMADPQYFNINTIFVPLNSCPVKISPDNSPKTLYTYQTSFVLSSPDKKYELLENLKNNNFNFDKYTVTVYDQGYELIRMILKNMIDSSTSLLLITGISVILILALLVYLYLIKRRREYVVMRVMGEAKHNAFLIFFLSILLIGFLGTMAGAIVAGKAAKGQLSKAYEVGHKAAVEEGIEGGIYSDTYIFDSELSITYILLPVIVIFVELFLFCLLGCLQFQKKSILQFISTRAET